MPISTKKVADWNCEETRDWFEWYGFDDPEVIKHLKRYKACARHILAGNLSAEELGITSIGGIALYPSRFKSLKIRNEKEQGIGYDDEDDDDECK